MNNGGRWIYKEEKGESSKPQPSSQGYIFLTLKRSLTPKWSGVSNPNAKSPLNRL